MATKRALIVDDSRTAQHRLKKLLRSYDLDIVAVDSAESALSYLSSSVPDVVFMDHLMPGMDGFRALQIIKSHPATATIPVIMYTSKSGDVYTSQARALGALDVVSKDTINATDLSHVLKAIHIYREEDRSASEKARRDSAPEAALPTEDVAATGQGCGEPDNPPETGNLLSLELRLRELEHTIDDNRRIVTSRLVREMQGVRHLVNKLATEVGDLKQANVDSRKTEEDSQEAESQSTHNTTRSRGGLARVAAVVALIALGGLGWWQLDRQMESVQAHQAEQSAQVSSALAEFERNAAHRADTAPVASSRSSTPPDTPLAERYLPDLSWAINQSSLQGFHRDLVAPETAQRLNELIARLSSRDFRGRIQVSVNAGDFCVVTDMGGQPQLPDSDSRMEDCALVSEFFGMNASDVMAERLEAMLAESSLYMNEAIDLIIRPLDRVFRDYPAMAGSTSAHEWNEAARLNNRVLVDLEPGAPLAAQAD
ncbi:response regulator [Marinimicrobium sp. C2-29]|uniref:response regulator n=1 Tax=Marinimicrobium sp. C2-29 TaxID=3139825 RepID=UPI003138DD84